MTLLPSLGPNPKSSKRFAGGWETMGLLFHSPMVSSVCVYYRHVLPHPVCGLHLFVILSFSGESVLRWGSHFVSLPDLELMFILLSQPLDYQNSSYHAWLMSLLSLVLNPSHGLQHIFTSLQAWHGVCLAAVTQFMLAQQDLLLWSSVVNS